MKSGLKVERRREKKGKIKRKKLQKIFCFGTSTWREEIPLIKVAYFMPNFLNLKSFLRHLFFGVAFCLSTLCDISGLFQCSLWLGIVRGVVMQNSCGDNLLELIKLFIDMVVGIHRSFSNISPC